MGDCMISLPCMEWLGCVNEAKKKTKKNAYELMLLVMCLVLTYLRVEFI